MTTSTTPQRTLIEPSLTSVGAPFELVVKDIEGYPRQCFVNRPATIRELLEESLALYAENTFLVYENERYTYRQVYQRVAKIADRLANQLGVKNGDAVAIAMRNYPEWIISYLATVSIGAVAVAINAWWGPKDLEHALQDCNARLVFADQERFNNLQACSGLKAQTILVRPNHNMSVKNPEPNVLYFTDLLANSSATALPDLSPNADDNAAIFYTSGSIGHPKGALSSHRAITYTINAWLLSGMDACGIKAKPGQSIAAMLADNPPLTPSVSLLSTPLFHITGCYGCLLSAMSWGEKLLLMYKWDAANAIQLIQNEQVAKFAAVPTITGDLVKEAARQKARLPSLLIIGGGGAMREPAQVKMIDQVFANAIPASGWSMTELNCLGTFIAGEQYLNDPSSAGYPLTGLELKVVDDCGRPLPNGKPGELLARSPSMFRAYLNNPEVTASAFTDGWFHTGDVAYIDDSGQLYIVDRIKNLVIRGGENISCGEVEAAFYEHPKINEAIVFGVPDERMGEELGAVAVILPGTELSKEALRNHLQGLLAAFQIPRYIRIQTGPLSRLASGKFDKKHIQQMFIDQWLSPKATTQRDAKS